MVLAQAEQVCHGSVISWFRNGRWELFSVCLVESHDHQLIPKDHVQSSVSVQLFTGCFRNRDDSSSMSDFAVHNDTCVLFIVTKIMCNDA